MLLKNHSTRKLKCLALSLLFVACAERPVYEPAPKSAAASSQQKSGTEKAGTAANTDTKTADAGTPEAPKTDVPPAVTPTPTPTPPPPAAPVEPVGVAATGRTLVMGNCIAAGCHGTSTLDAKTEVALANGTAIAAHPAALRNMGFFVRPAAGSQPTNYSHVLAYLKANAAPILGPNIP